MKLCLGTVQFGLNYGIQGNLKPEKEKVFEMLSYAIDNGIDLLDTAPVYGDAESVLGEYVREYPTKIKTVGIVSKLRPDAFDHSNNCDWSGIAIENAQNSLEKIGVKKFVAYLFHNARYIFDKKAVMALNAVKDAGLADRIGVSVYTPQEALQALQYPEVKAIQIPYNLFDHRWDKCGFFQKAIDQDILVFARSTLLQGLIMMGPEDLPSKVSFARDYILRFKNIYNNYNIDPLSCAIGYVGCKDAIDYIVFGVDNLKQLKEYVALQDAVLPKDLIDRIDNEFENVEERLVNPVLWK